LVACGRTWSGAPLCIADPATRQPCAAGQIGEIWVAGPSVALGYWNDPERTAATFGAYTADGHGPYLRTGDLGFVVDGELFVTGRIKDVMIVSGRNHYPQDIELTASQSDPELMGRPAAAFLLPDEGEEAIALVHEVSKAFALRYARAPEVARLRQLESKIRNAVAREHGLALKRVVLVAQGQLPMTTSGKIRRATSQKLWLDKQLEQLGGESHSA
jgi:acyl-CoA synthetase (AMP-forming)/AMP-acid ligase II